MLMKKLVCFLLSTNAELGVLVQAVRGRLDVE